MSAQTIGAVGAAPAAKTATAEALSSIGSAMNDIAERMAESGTAVQQGEALRALDRAKDTEHQPERC
jgi:hypothetical protein